MKLHLLLGGACFVTGIIAYVVAQARIDRWMGAPPESPHGRGLLGLVFLAISLAQGLARAGRYATRTNRFGLTTITFLSVAVMVFGFVMLARGLLALPR